MRRQLPNLSLTTSDIIRTFASANYEMMLRDDREKFYKFKNQLKRRRNIQTQNMKKMGIKAPQDSKLSNIEKFMDSLGQFKYHLMTKEQLAEKLQTNFTRGLTQEVAEIRSENNPNIIQGPPKKHWALVFISQMSDPFSLFIWFLIVLSFIGFAILEDSNQLLLAIILIITIISGAIISFGFVKQSESAIEDFQSFLPNFALVVRDGVTKSIRAKKVVVGDIVRIRSGENVPADLRIIDSVSCKVNRATFTGQSLPVEVTSQCTNRLSPLDSLNIVYSGMTIVQGEATGVIFSTGQSTLISKIQNLISSAQEKPSYLENQIARFVKYITIFAVSIGLFVFSLGSVVGFPVVIAADLAVGVTVASAPGVLNLELVCILFISVKELAKKKFVCKNLVAVEAFGSTEILCTDKTGTLTSNQMSVDHLYYDNQIFTATNAEMYDQHEYDVKNRTFRALHECAILSTAAFFDIAPPRQELTKISSRTDIINSQKQIRQRQIELSWLSNEKNRKIHERQISGDSTESALIRFFHPLQDIQQTKKRFPITRNKKKGENRVLFNSHDKYSLSVNAQEWKNSHYCINIKGAPQKIWNLCKFVMKDGMVCEKDEESERKLQEIIKKWGKEGKRVLGFAKLHLKGEKYKPSYEFDMDTIGVILKDMIFLGLVSLQDPPRKGVNETMKKIKGAGIKIIIITGDQETTALSIGRQCNIISSDLTVGQIEEQTGCSKQQAFLKAKNIVVTGEELTRLINEDFVKPLHEQGKKFIKIIQKQGVIFARTSPSQKLFIVEQLQKLGYIVGVTGDGVNDSPAIKVANTGIAMGSGSDAAKDSSDIVIANDDLNLIFDGIEHGRRAFDNFKKAICYVMTSQISEWTPFVFLIVTRIPIPIFTLLIDGAADFVPTIAFAFEESEKGIMTRPPKKNNEHLIDFALILQCQGWMGFSSFLSCLASYYIVMIDFGFIPENLWGKSNVHIILEADTDIYNPSNPYFGNSNLSTITSCDDFLEHAVRVDWINSSFPKTDLRLSGVICQTREDGSFFFEQIFQFGQCRVQQISPYTEKPICYTPEATKYGQTSYMYANVINQVFNWVICRTRKDSAITKRFNNQIYVFGLGCELMMALALSYTSFMISLIGTRDVIFQHYGINTIPFAIIQLCLDELRKYLIRNLPKTKEGLPNWFERTLMW